MRACAQAADRGASTDALAALFSKLTAAGEYGMAAKVQLAAARQLGRPDVVAQVRHYSD